MTKPTNLVEAEAAEQQKFILGVNNELIPVEDNTREAEGRIPDATVECNSTSGE